MWTPILKRLCYDVKTHWHHEHFDRGALNCKLQPQEGSSPMWDTQCVCVCVFQVYQRWPHPAQVVGFSVHQVSDDATIEALPLHLCIRSFWNECGAVKMSTMFTFLCSVDQTAESHLRSRMAGLHTCSSLSAICVFMFCSVQLARRRRLIGCTSFGIDSLVLSSKVSLNQSADRILEPNSTVTPQLLVQCLVQKEILARISWEKFPVWHADVTWTQRAWLLDYQAGFGLSHYLECYFQKIISYSY